MSHAALRDRWVLVALVAMAGAVGPRLSHGVESEATDVVKMERTLGVRLLENAAGRIAVDKVMRGGPADAAGVRPGDLLVAADGKAMVSVAEFAHFWVKQSIGERVKLTISRGDRLIDRSVHVPNEVLSPGAPSAAGEESLVLGMALIENEKGRILVADVVPAGCAADAGIKEGDVLLSVDGFIPTSLEDFSERVRELSQARGAGDQLTFALARGDENQSIQVTLPGHEDKIASIQAPTDRSAHVAVGRLVPLSGDQSGGLAFLTLRSRGNSADVELQGEGFPAGTYRLLVHEYGDCGDVPHGSAGEPWEFAQHSGSKEPGVLAEITVNQGGTLKLGAQVEGLRFAGARSVLGRAVVLYVQTAQNEEPLVAGVLGIGNPKRAQGVAETPRGRGTGSSGSAAGPAHPEPPGPQGVR